MTTFRAVVLEHFRHPHNRGSLDGANATAEGANPLCGDRLRVELRIENDRVTEARFTADACALCIAAASLLTDAVRGRSIVDVGSLDAQFLEELLGGPAPAARVMCVRLPLDAVRRALAAGGFLRGDVVTGEAETSSRQTD